MRRSYELFARYVMPHFRGHTAGYQDEWRRIQAAAANGGVAKEESNASSNLLLRNGSES
jgi:hypothetical protein